MESDQIKAKIAQLERMRREMTWWRIGGVIAAFAIVGVCLSLLNTSVRDLTEKGPPQDIYITHLQQGLSKDFVPRLQEVASRTLTEMQPVVQTEFQRLNTRVPELTQATIKQAELLQTSLPKRAENVLDETFTAALKSQEPMIRKTFPSVKEDQVRGLMTSLVDMAGQRGSRVADELLLPHTEKTKKILENLRAIETSEPQNATGESADWEMGLLVFDLVRGDLDPSGAAKDASTNATAGKMADKMADKTPANVKAVDAQVTDPKAMARTAYAETAAKAAELKAADATAAAKIATDTAAAADAAEKAAATQATAAKAAANAAYAKAAEAKAARRAAAAKAAAAKDAADEAAYAKRDADRKKENNR